VLGVRHVELSPDVAVNVQRKASSTHTHTLMMNISTFIIPLAFEEAKALHGELLYATRHEKAQQLLTR